MGRPYASELSQLSATLDWASAVEIGSIRQAALATAQLPLLAVGSGGSLTAAHHLASLHRRLTGRLASVATPLTALSELDPAVSVWLLSGGGSNVDILNAFSSLVRGEPNQLTVICGRRQSRLAEAAAQHRFVELFDAEGPVHKDGFLATNSLLAASILVSRAYTEAFDGDPFLLSLKQYLSEPEELEQRRATIAPLWSRDTMIVLHGGSTAAAAIDLESKFTEAALGHLQVADYRNFAHGRHHWLAKRRNETAVLALSGPEDRLLATKTLAMLPRSIPAAHLEFEGNFTEVGLVSLVTALHIAGWAGEARGIDPGRPGVPEFGRRLFRLGTRPSATKLTSAADSGAIRRKANASIHLLERRGDIEHWRRALESFKGQVTDAQYGAVVFDYDGTLVDTRERYVAPRPEIVTELRRLLSGGLIVGIATGRGASVRADLQSCIPKRLWSRVVIGYYNGAEVAALSDDSSPDGTKAVRPELKGLSDALTENLELSTIATLSPRPWQITIESRDRTGGDRLWDLVNQVVQLNGIDGVVLRSTHSIDVLAPGVSKVAVLKSIDEMLATSSNRRILKIGDRGRWPGNDFMLLREPYALSVDEVSVDPLTCWNLAPLGYRGPQVTLEYCRSLRHDKAIDGWKFLMRPWRNA